MVPVQGRHVRPDLLEDGLSSSGAEVAGGRQVAGVPDDDGVDDDAQSGGSVELSLVVAVGEPASSGEGDRSSHRMEPLLPVEPGEHAPPELVVVDVRKEMAGLRKAPELLDRLLERALAPKVLKLGDHNRRGHEAVPERGGESVHVVPMGGDEVSPDAAAENGAESP